MGRSKHLGRKIAIGVGLTAATLLGGFVADELTAELGLLGRTSRSLLARATVREELESKSVLGKCYRGCRKTTRRSHSLSMSGEELLSPRSMEQQQALLPPGTKNSLSHRVNQTMTAFEERFPKAKKILAERDVVERFVYDDPMQVLREELTRHQTTTLSGQEEEENLTKQVAKERGVRKSMPERAIEYAQTTTAPFRPERAVVTEYGVYKNRVIVKVAYDDHEFMFYQSSGLVKKQYVEPGSFYFTGGIDESLPMGNLVKQEDFMQGWPNDYLKATDPVDPLNRNNVSQYLMGVHYHVSFLSDMADFLNRLAPTL